MEWVNVLIGIASALFTLVSLGIAYWAGKVASSQKRVAERDLTLTAYANALQDGILGLKGTFAEHPEIFEKQVQLNPEIQKYIPSYMDVLTFLTFAGGMWRLSYVFSVMRRGKSLGLTEAECVGLKKEMVHWLHAMPGFYDIYRTHINVVKVHNPEFLAFLEKDVYNEEFLRWRECPSLL